MLRKVLPHAAILLSNMYIVFYLIDRVNSAMCFIDNGITKALLVLLAIISTVNASFLILDARRKIARDERRRAQPRPAQRSASHPAQQSVAPRSFSRPAQQSAAPRSFSRPAQQSAAPRSASRPAQQSVAQRDDSPRYDAPLRRSRFGE